MKKLKPFNVAVVVWIIFVGGVLCYALQKPKVEYVEVQSQPKILTEVVTVEKEVLAAPYYANIAASITAEDMDLLAAITYLEAGNQSLLGQRAVVEVIFNRVESPLFPNNIHDVIFQTDPLQFSTSRLLSAAAPTDKQYEAIRMTLEENVPLLPSDVLYFGAGGERRNAYDIIGAHHFYY